MDLPTVEEVLADLQPILKEDNNLEPKTESKPTSKRSLFEKSQKNLKRDREEDFIEVSSESNAEETSDEFGAHILSEDNHTDAVKDCLAAAIRKFGSEERFEQRKKKEGGLGGNNVAFFLLLLLFIIYFYYYFYFIFFYFLTKKT